MDELTWPLSRYHGIVFKPRPAPPLLSLNVPVLLLREPSLISSGSCDFSSDCRLSVCLSVFVLAAIRFPLPLVHSALCALETLSLQIMTGVLFVRVNDFLLLFYLLFFWLLFVSLFVVLFSPPPPPPP